VKFFEDLMRMRLSNPIEGPQEPKWQLLMVLLLSILFSYAPLIYGHFIFIERGVSKNDVMVSVVIPFLSLVFMFVVIVSVRRFLSGTTPFTITWLSQKKLSDIFGAVILTVIIFMGNVILWNVLNRLGIPTAYAILSADKSGVALLIVYTFLTAFVTPIVEEIFWRGTIQDGMERVFGGPASIFVQAILFAICHLRCLGATLQLFFLGLALGVWRWRKRTLLPLIMTHMFGNILGCAILWYNHMELQRVRIKNDYGVLLEELCKPTNYMPEENALPCYKRAFKFLVEIPNELDKADVKDWPVDLSDEKISLLRNWISSNQHAIIEFEAGTQKPYFCPQYERPIFMGLWHPELLKVSPMILVMVARAQTSAAQGDVRQSISDVITCYRFGQHLSSPKPLIDQLVGLGVKEWVLQVAYRILQRTVADDFWLKELQAGLETISERDIVPIGFSGERLVCYDLIQSTFTDDEGEGLGRIPRTIIDQMRNPPAYMRSLGFSPGSQELSKVWRHIKRGQTTQLTDEVFAYLDSIKDHTPAELHRTNRGIKNIIHQIAQDNAFILMLTEQYEKIYHRSYRCKARKDALIITIAIMRYRLGQGELPDELYQLVREGYLDSIPLDPYSDEPFIYKKLHTDFLLYSLGPDFDDDGGTRSNKDISEGDDVFWPPEDN
jgi:membrane protease YdiL (CAAX protease family)